MQRSIFVLSMHNSLAVLLMLLVVFILIESLLQLCISGHVTNFKLINVVQQLVGPGELYRFTVCKILQLAAFRLAYSTGTKIG